MLGLLEEVSGKKRRKLADTHGPYARAVLAAKPLAYWRLNEFAPPTARDATGHGHAASYDWERGVAFHLLGAGNGVGASSTPSFTTPAFSGANQINRAPHFAGGSLKAELKNLGANYSVTFWLWNGLDPKTRATTGIAFARADERLGITGTNAEPGRLFFTAAGRPPLVGQTELRLKDWHQVVLARAGRTVAVYLDGATTPEISGEAGDAHGRELFFGGSAENTFGLEGKLDEVAVFDRALTAADAAQLHRAAGFPTRLAKAAIR